MEIESIPIGSFAALGSYADIDNETSLRYSVTNALRLSIGTLSDYFSVHGAPSLRDRNGPEFSGLIAEVRWHVLNWQTSPFGMSLSINPLWRRTDELSGQSSGNYAVLVTLLVDKEVVSEKFFAEFNLIYQPSFLRPNDSWDSFIVIAGGSCAISPSILVGAEIRHENSAQNWKFDVHALYVGPQLFV